jgi:hypothetical protein
MSRPFRLTKQSVSAPLSFDQIRDKYGASARDAAEVRGFVFGTSADARRPSGKGVHTRLRAGKPKTSGALKSKRLAGKSRPPKTKETRARKRIKIAAKR